MKNLIGATVAVIFGAPLLVLLLGAAPPAYPQPFQIISFLLFGCSLLEQTVEGLLSISDTGPYIATWFLIGGIVSVFSDRGWNTVRTVLWVAIITGLLSLMSRVLLVPGFWESPTRNLDLIILFGGMALLSLAALPSAYPLTVVKERLQREAERPIPELIETKCECGAVFRSNPIMCSECGRVLRETKD